MILTIDIGNSNTVVVGYDETRVFEDRIITAKNNGFEYYVRSFQDMSLKDVEDVIVSCVVPRVQDEITRAIEDVFKLKPILINARTIKNFKIHLDKPEEIGADFIATSFGALGKYDMPAIVADAGSATKLTYTTQSKEFGGGVIIPGLGTSVQAFQEYIPHLPDVPLVVPKKVIGNSTTDAIQSGVMYGLISQVEGIASKMEREIGQPCIKILTGGYGHLIHEKTEGFIFDPYLLNDGLFEIYTKGMFVR